MTRDMNAPGLLPSADVLQRTHALWDELVLTSLSPVEATPPSAWHSGVDVPVVDVLLSSQ